MKLKILNLCLSMSVFLGAINDSKAEYQILMEKGDVAPYRGILVTIPAWDYYQRTDIELGILQREIKENGKGISKDDSNVSLGLILFLGRVS